MNNDGFKIILANSTGNSAKVLITFENGVNAFRNSDETFRLSTIGYLNKNYGGQFYAKWTFFKVESSEYLKWLSEQSGGISDYYGVTQYSIITDDEILDVVCTYEPKVTFISQNTEKCDQESTIWGNNLSKRPSIAACSRKC